MKRSLADGKHFTEQIKLVARLGNDNFDASVAHDELMNTLLERKKKGYRVVDQYIFEDELTYLLEKVIQ